ncbi:MAG: HAMP domain-containing histidine kinase [Melioribacteraceae bacterium]|nr:HAMP domain-containing histidine kinase [Melioribacteraceae bacterium]
MKKRHSLFYHILIFVLAQLAWLGLLGLWIYWYVSNYLILEKVGDQLSPKIDIDTPNVLVFVGGIVLIVALAFGVSIIFRNLSVQIKITKLYDNFIANITHELKSPLSSIQLYLETLKEKHVSDKKREEFITLMLKDTSRLNNLINSILEISALEQKKIAYNYEIYSADSVFQELINGSIEQFNLPRNAISIAADADCGCVIDINAFRIVINNLIDNAVKYSKDSVVLSFNISRNGSNLMLSVCDNGIGILEKDQKNVFDKFNRIYNRDVPTVKGSGMGLYWVKEIIKYHGGKIIVTSEGLGFGTCFIIKLPVYQRSKKHFINKLLKLSLKKNRPSEMHNE